MSVGDPMHDDLRAISVRQPWPELIARGVKTLEIRSWSTAYRGPLLIVSGVARHALGPRDVDGPRGCAIVLVDLVDVRLATPEDAAECGGLAPEAGSFAWVLANARRVETLPVVGRLGLFSPPPGVVARILAA